MKLKWSIIAAGIWLIVLALIGVSLVKLSRFPQTHPDQTLQIEQAVTEFFQRITLPIKIAKLAGLEADKELLMPVHGHRVSEIADTWGSARSGGRTHEGQDIFAARGTPVFSATSGYVLRKSESELGGNAVYIIGAGGVRYYYAHLDRFPAGLNAGDEVTPDTIIGFVGNTGNAQDTPYHLHFGMYVSREAINPLPLLVNR